MLLLCSPKASVWHSEKQGAGLEGPLICSSRAFLLSLLWALWLHTAPHELLPIPSAGVTNHTFPELWIISPAHGPRKLDLFLPGTGCPAVYTFWLCLFLGLMTSLSSPLSLERTSWRWHVLEEGVNDTSTRVSSKLKCPDVHPLKLIGESSLFFPCQAPVSFICYG